MATNVIMPQLGESVVEGTVSKWLIPVGETVEEFAPLLEVNTDKVDTEIPSPASGTLLRVYVSEGETVRAGTVLAILGEPGESVPEAVEPTAVGSTAVEPTAETLKMAKPDLVTVERTPPGRPNGGGFISPVVARIAAEHSINLGQVQGTGRGGRITKKDVLAYLESKPAPTGTTAPWESPASGELFRPSEEVYGSSKAKEGPKSDAKPGELLPLTVVRKSIAEHMVRSRKTSPHVTTLMEADLTRVATHRKRNKEIFQRDGVKLTYLAYFVASAVAGLKAWPIGNSTWQDDGIRLHQELNIGIAVSLGEEGLIVPVIKNADQASLLGIAAAIENLAGRARAHQLDPNDVQGGTFTITNHGGSGSLLATPIINQPQAAILGVGKVQKRVVAIETSAPSGENVDSIAIRPMVYLTLTFDHRILDGAIADYLLGEIVSKLENWN